MTMRLTPLIPLILVAAFAAGCGTAPDSSLRGLAPPPGWGETIREDRTDKDEGFAQGADSPLLPEDRAGFQGLDYWEPNPDLYFVGPIRFYEQPETFRIPATSGGDRPCARVGFVEFSYGGSTHKLQIYQLMDQRPGDGSSLFLPFKDATTGEDTYPAGRYLDIAGTESGPFVLDFNRAKNPFCAYGDPSRFACPVAPAENTLSFRLEAGERGFKLPATES